MKSNVLRSFSPNGRATWEKNQSSVSQYRSDRVSRPLVNGSSRTTQVLSLSLSLVVYFSEDFFSYFFLCASIFYWIFHIRPLLLLCLRWRRRRRWWHSLNWSHCSAAEWVWELYIVDEGFYLNSMPDIHFIDKCRWLQYCSWLHIQTRKIWTNIIIFTTNINIIWCWSVFACTVYTRSFLCTE